MFSKNNQATKYRIEVNKKLKILFDEKDLDYYIRIQSMLSI